MVAPGSVIVRAGLDEVPRLQALLVRIGRLRRGPSARHRGGVVGVVGAGAEDGRRERHRRHQLGLGERQALGAAFGGAGGGLLQRALGRLPVGEDAGDGRIGGLAGELGGVEYVVADHEARARTFARLICRELVSRPLPVPAANLPPAMSNVSFGAPRISKVSCGLFGGPGTTSSSFRGRANGEPGILAVVDRTKLTSAGARRRSALRDDDSGLVALRGRFLG